MGPRINGLEVKRPDSNHSRISHLLRVQGLAEAEARKNPR